MNGNDLHFYFLLFNYFLSTESDEYLNVSLNKRKTLIKFRITKRHSRELFVNNLFGNNLYTHSLCCNEKSCSID